jgi:hypothetical protein
MRIPFISLFTTSPFDGLQEHAEKVKECAWVFQRAIECIIEDRCEDFEQFRKPMLSSAASGAIFPKAPCWQWISSSCSDI